MPGVRDAAFPGGEDAFCLIPAPTWRINHLISNIKEKKTMESKAIPLYASEAEKRLHANTINQLCQELSESAEIIRPLYEKVLSELKKEAKIKDYLTILVARIVRESAKGNAGNQA
jgi:hypothetical protein